MKKTFFGSNSEEKNAPFWQPWGCLGYLGRLLGFLVLLILLILLLSLFRQCNDGGGGRSGAPISGVSDPEWNQPIDGGERVGLPSPEENNIPPFEESTPVPNPDNGGATEIYPNLLYVILDSESDDQAFMKFAEEFTSRYPEPEHKIEYYNTGSKTAILTVPEEKRDLICNNLPSEIPDVKFFIIPVEVMGQYAEVIPNDPAFNDADKSWYFKPIQIQEAWEITQGSSDIIVGIVDSYMDLNHPELQGDRFIYPYSVVSADANVAPAPGASAAYAGHGTLVTSIAVGNINNSQGSAGIAPKCKFIPVSMGHHLNTVTMVEGLLYCMYHGASVINLSCGMMFPETLTRMPIEKQIQFSEETGLRQEEMWDYVFKLAEKRNVTIVWAAGNENCFSGMDASKRNPNTIRVSAVDRNLKRAEFSNFGNFPRAGVNESTISAPGVDIWGALPGNSYDAWPGTSFSAPIITGVVALIKSQNKDLTTAQIIEILQSTGKPVQSAPEIGNLVQAKEALIKAQETVSTATTR